MQRKAFTTSPSLHIHHIPPTPRPKALLATAGVCVNRVGQILVVHAPLGERMGGIMKRLLMAVLPHAYASKLEFVDVHRLQEWVHPDELHADYGGNNTCVALFWLRGGRRWWWMDVPLTFCVRIHTYTHRTPLGESHDEKALRNLLEENRLAALAKAEAEAAAANGDGQGEEDGFN